MPPKFGILIFNKKIIKKGLTGAGLMTSEIIPYKNMDGIIELNIDS